MAAAVLTPLPIALTLRHALHLTPQSATLIHCFSSLLLGAALSTLATLNFSQALFIGLLAAPLSFVRPFSPRKSLPLALKLALGLLAVVAIAATSPPAIWLAGGYLSGKGYAELLAVAAWAWKVERVWTAVTVWIVWWPAWVCGSVVLLSGMV